MEWPYEDSFTVPTIWQYLAGLEKVSPEGCFSNSQDSWPRNQGVKMRLAPLTITFSDPVAKFLFPVPETLCSARLKIVPEG